MFNVCAIAASSAENGFCSDLAPNVTKKLFSFSFRYRGGCFSITPPNPTSSFRAELLTATCIDPPGIVGESGIASTPVCMRVSYGANVNEVMVSSVSISMFLSASATWYSGERWYLLNFLMQAVLLRSGLVSGRVWMSVHIFTALLQKRRCAAAM
jgi:hypothetical protein